MDGFGRVNGGGAPGDAASSGRDGERESFFLASRIRLADSDTLHEGRVRNLSAGGMMVEFARPVAPGVAITLEIRGLGELTGQVAWCTRGRIGVALDQPIDPQQARLPIGGGGATPSYAKPVTTMYPRPAPPPRRR